MASKTELLAALKSAVAHQFGGLFSVLCVAPDPDAGLEKFALGLQKLLNSEHDAIEVIQSVEERPADDV